jgi:hypothetical protein
MKKRNKAGLRIIHNLEEDRRRKFVVISAAIAWHVLYSFRKKKARRGKDISKREYKRQYRTILNQAITIHLHHEYFESVSRGRFETG